jgi:S-DNA-T family DNA segregation ATPase FtsK/SpoIIIE
MSETKAEAKAATAAAAARRGGFRFWHALLVVGVVLLLLALFSHHPDDLAVLEGGSDDALRNWIGPAGAHTARMLLYLFGVGAYPLLLLMIVCALRPLMSAPTQRQGYVGALVAVTIGTTVLFAMWPENLVDITSRLGIGHGGAPASALSGGVLGQKLAAPLDSPAPGLLTGTIGMVGAAITALVFLLSGIGFLAIADWLPVWRQWQAARQAAQGAANEVPGERRELRERLRRDREERLRREQEEKERAAAGVAPDTEAEPAAAPSPAAPREPDLDEDDDAERAAGAVKAGPVKAPARKSAAKRPAASQRPGAVDYRLPPMNLLEPVKSGEVGETAEAIKRNQETLQSTLDSFGLDATVTGAVSGPRVTRYEIAPEPGVKVEKISGISNNIAMDLQAKSIRVLAPIPGKNAVGVEVPNRTMFAVLLREIMESEAWKGSKAEIPVILGKEVSGNVAITDLAKAPHLLIAGATGSGKSVCINTLIMSLLYRFTPDELGLILVDPKVVEFEIYKTLPHLLTEVVNDPKKVPRALRWAIGEMERRYRVLAKVGVRNLASFNARAVPKEPVLDDAGEPIPPHLPFIVIVIDELADIIMLAKAEVETYIARIAQKARAVGIHMVLATQTPRKDIITGVIKANLPTRIAFQVRSVVDSRVILDQKGAESLLGRGDMLFIPPGSANLERLQGPMVSDKEISAVVGFASAQMEPRFIEAVVAEDEDEESLPGLGGDGEEREDGDLAMSPDDLAPAIRKFLQPGDDENFARALEVVLTEGKASTSYVQRRLKIGYNRAADIIDTMQKRGIVGPPPASGGANREILVDLDADGA